MDDTSDFLDELISEGMTEDSEVAALVDSAVRRRELLRSFGRRRETLGISQRRLAARMRTQQPAIARLERGESDPKLSTLERYAAALGLTVNVTLVGQAARSPREPEGVSDQNCAEEQAVVTTLAKH